MDKIIKLRMKMMNMEKIITITITGIIGISGWITFLYTYISNQPKIVGKLFNVIIGQWSEMNKTSFCCYVYLTNQRKAAVHILDYELEVDFGEGFKRLERVYGLDNIQEFNFFIGKGSKQITIPDFQKQLIYKKDNLVQFGFPIHGFIIFAGEPLFHDKIKDIRLYRLKCIDAFGKKHIITTDPKKFPNLYLLQDMTGMKIPN